MVVITKNITKKYLQPTLFGEDLDRQSPHGIPSQVASARVQALLNHSTEGVVVSLLRRGVH